MPLRGIRINPKIKTTTPKFRSSYRPHCAALLSSISPSARRERRYRSLARCVAVADVRSSWGHRSASIRR